MPKRKEPELDPKNQYERFREAARQAELSNDEDAFAKVFKRIAPKPRAKAPQKKLASNKAAKKRQR